MSANHTGPKGFVLVAEDVKVISRKMITALEQSGYKVALAEDGEQCLKMARSLMPNLIVLDIMMPKIHGIEVMKQLRADPATKDIGVVVCTAKSFETELNYASALGAYDVLIKPFNISALTGMVSGFFESQPGKGKAVEPRPGADGAQAAEVFRQTLQTQSKCLTLWAPAVRPPRPALIISGMAGKLPAWESQLKTRSASLTPVLASAIWAWS